MAAAKVSSAQAELEQALHTSLDKASSEEIVGAIKVLVAKNPKSAQPIIEALGKAGRDSSHCEMADFVRESIAALGDQAKPKAILALVQTAVKAEPKCAPRIVAAAIHVAPPNLANSIVETAVASLADPTLKVGDLTIVEAIVQAALVAIQNPNALPPIAIGPGETADAASIASAANRGLQSSLASLVGGTTTPPAPDFQALSGLTAATTPTAPPATTPATTPPATPAANPPSPTPAPASL